MAMKAITLREALDLLFQQGRRDLLWGIRRMQSTHAIVYENQTLDSSRLGCISVLLVGGPNCTWAFDNHPPRLGDLPSNFKYPTSYVNLDFDREDVIEPLIDKLMEEVSAY